MYSVEWKMGMYPDHGIEYHIILKDGQHIVVLCSREVDDRLIASEYYKKRRESWFEDMWSRCDPITEDVDIQMSDQEKNKLEKLLNEYGSGVSSHGWYDVMTICSSL